MREWTVRGTGASEVEWSQKGYLGVANGGGVNVSFPCKLKAFSLRLADLYFLLDIYSADDRY